jgi:hypothetical protein
MPVDHKEILAIAERVLNCGSNIESLGYFTCEQLARAVKELVAENEMAVRMLITANTSFNEMLLQRNELKKENERLLKDEASACDRGNRLARECQDLLAEIDRLSLPRTPTAP